VSDPQRLLRLTSGGIPLPDAFGAVMTRLIDDGPQNRESLTRILFDTLHYKRKRILSTWDSWEDFSRDVLAQLTDARLAGSDGKELYFLRPDTEMGVRYDVIPEAKIGITLWDEKSRKTRDASSVLRMEVRRLLEIHEDASPDARKYLAMAESALTSTLKEIQKPRVIKGTTLAKEDRGDPPAPESIAKAKYGFDGHRPSRNTPARNRFGRDGLRACTRCGKRKPPGGFPVYWSDHTERPEQTDCWYLRSTCLACRDEIDRLKKKKP
jgi:hypothetical protein